MGEEVGKEPGGWELYRGIERIGKQLDTIAAGTLSASVWAVEKAALEGRLTGIAETVAKTETARIADREELDTYRKEQEDQRNKNRLFVYGLIATPVIGGIVLFLLSGGLNR